jgi:hypothetical protein
MRAISRHVSDWANSFRADSSPGYLGSADQSSDRASAYDVRLDIGFSQRFDDAYVRPAANCAAAERKSNARTRH